MGEEKEKEVVVVVVVEEEARSAEVGTGGWVEVGSEADDSCVGQEDVSCGCAKACRPHLRPYGAVSLEHVHAQAGQTSMPMPVLSNSGVGVDVLWGSRGRTFDPRARAGVWCMFRCCCSGAGNDGRELRGDGVGWPLCTGRRCGVPV